MRNLRLIRAGTLAIAFVLAGATAAYADTVPADGDLATAGPQMSAFVGTYVTGQVVQVPVDFTLTCAGTAHADENQIVTLALATAIVPLDGAVSATPATVGPVPASWPDDGQPCGSPVPTLASNGPSTVTLTMPTSPGLNQAFTLLFSRSGASDLTDLSLVTLRVNVIVNTPPALVLPGPMAVEGSAAGGAVVSYDASATDVQDDPDPTPTCAPASGTFFALGTTTVNCTVTDAHGASTSGSFDVTVGDSTDPTFAGVADIAVTTDDPGGAVVTYDTPAASDVVDPAPTVACAPPSGDVFPVGPTTVTCTATDASGNTATTSFRVVVTYDPGVTWSVTWGEPVGGSPASLVANQGRTVPLKLQIFANGVEQRTGAATVRVAPCGGGDPVVASLTYGSGRWNGHLDTSGMRPGCWTATATLGGAAAGSFALDLRGADTAAGPVKSNGSKK